MATNLVTSGDLLEMTAKKRETIKKGYLVRRGNVVGIALNNARPGQPFRLALSGVWTIDKIAKKKKTPLERAYDAGWWWADCLIRKTTAKRGSPSGELKVYAPVRVGSEKAGRVFVRAAP